MTTSPGIVRRVSCSRPGTVQTHYVDAFVQAARDVDNQFFNTVLPIRRPGDGRITSVVLYSTDLDGISDELAMPEVVQQLAGILAYDITIVSAWEGGRTDRERSGLKS